MTDTTHHICQGDCRWFGSKLQQRFVIQERTSTSATTREEWRDVPTVDPPPATDDDLAALDDFIYTRLGLGGLLSASDFKEILREHGFDIVRIKPEGETNVER